MAFICVLFWRMYLCTNKLLPNVRSKTWRYGQSILYEEIFEAVAAYQKEDPVHAQQELAQCGAVILRTMEMLENEIEEKEP